MLKFSSTEIDNILYSALRSKKHFQIRQKSYLKRALQLIYLYLTVPSKDYPKNKKVVLNYLSKSNIDFSGMVLGEDFKFDLEESQTKSLYIVEFLIILSFLLPIKFLQRSLFNLAGRLTRYVFNTRNIEFLICGHPDLLISFLGFCLKEDYKEVITVQHGIYNLSSYRVLWWEKEVATKIILYGEDYKKLYISQGVDKNKILIGNPYFGSLILSTEYKKVNPYFKNKKVIFLGQQLYKISESVYSVYNDFLEELINFFEAKGVETFYKPHPREELQKSLNSTNLNRIKLYNKDNGRKDLLTQFDFYYSVNSSILIELYLQKKICFQVDMPIEDFIYDNFRDYTGIPLVNIQNLPQHLNFNEYKFYYDPEYLNIKNNYNQHMVSLIGSILAKTKLNKK